MRKKLLAAYPGGALNYHRDRREFLREHPICVSCQGELASQLDHRVPIHVRPDLFADKGNWQALCRSCHWSKTAGENKTKVHPEIERLREYVREL